MNVVKENKTEKIENLIYEVRGVQVMLDSDLARLYECAKEKYDYLKFQNENSRLSSHGGGRKLPYVFTKQGALCLQMN